MKCLQRGTLIVALGGLLLACGQKGPLVLPDAPKHKRTVPPLPSSAKPNSAPGTPSPASDPPAPPGNPSPASPNTPPASPASSFNGMTPNTLTLRS